MKQLRNAAAEQLLLGSCVRHPETLDAIIERVGASDFADPRAGSIFAAICRITLAGKSGSVALVEDLRESGELDAIGGDKAITYLESKARKNVDEVRAAADIVVDLAKKRDQVAAASRIAQTIADGGDPAADLDQLTSGGIASREGWAALGSVLTSIIEGTHRKLEPTLLERCDGASLLYQARLNWIAAPPESMKSWLAKLTCVQAAEKGHPTVYVDFEESDATSFTERICSIALGRGHSIDTVRTWFEGTADNPNARLFYYRPATEGLDTAARSQVLRIVRQRQVPFVVLDGVAAAMASHTPALEEDKARDVNLWLGAYAWPLVNAGAGVLCVDHTVKNTQNQSGFAARAARGSGAKLAAVSGAALLSQVKEPGSAWTRGEVHIYIVKDRPGRVKVSSRSGQRLAAILTSTPQPAQMVEITKLELLSPEVASEQAAEKQWHLIAAEQICKILNDAGKTLSKGDVKEMLDARKRERGGRGWKADTVVRAIQFLTDHGWVAVERDGRFEMMALVKQYQADFGLVHADEMKQLPVGGNPF